MTADGTVSLSFRPPALSTTRAVITFVMLATGRSVLRSRLHRIAPLSAFAIAAAAATTPEGPVCAFATGAVPAKPAIPARQMNAVAARARRGMSQDYVL